MHKELRELAQLIEERRKQLGLSKNALCQKFGQLGSTKTYGRLLDASDDLDELNLEKQLENYRAAWELLQGFNEDPEETKIYGDFAHMRDALATVSEALQQTDNTRLVLVTGRSGGGKSTFLDLLECSPRTQNIVYRCEATEAWRESTFELLGAILRKVGVYDRAPKADGDESRSTADADSGLPRTPGGRLLKLIERLDGRKVIIAIDEFHHVGPSGYNIVKTIINQTRAVVVATAIPELIQKLNRTHYQEASQLFSNRLYAHISFGIPQSGDVMEFMKRRGLKFASTKDAADITKKVAADAESYGMWKYIVRCTRQARKQGAGPFDQESFAKVITKVKGSISLGG